MISEIFIQQSAPSTQHVLENKIGYSNLSDDIIINFMRYLPAQYIFKDLSIVHKRNERILKKLIFWKILYAAPFDIKQSQQDYLSKNFNRQVFLLYGAIKANATDFLLNESQSWDLKVIFSILPNSNKKKFFLLELLYQSQLPLTIQYLTRAREKRQSFAQQVQSKLLEFKNSGFGHLQLPPDQLAQIGHEADEKKSPELHVRSEQFLKILKTLKPKLLSDLENFKHKLSSDIVKLTSVKDKLTTDEYKLATDKHKLAVRKFDYLKFFLKILLWDNEDTQNVIFTSENFQKLLFETVQSLRLDSYYEEFIFDKSVKELKPFYDYYELHQMNGLLLGVSIGNLHFLKACAKPIRAFFSLPYIYSNKKSPFITDLPIKLLSEATRKGHEAVVQFLGEQELKAQLETKAITTNHHAAIHQAICSKNYNLIMLNIAYGGISTCQTKQGQLIHSTHMIPPILDFLAMIILTQANTSIDAGNETLFENIANTTYAHLKVGLRNSESENKYHNRIADYCETIRFMIMLGADTGKIKKNNSKVAINYVLKFSQVESKIFNLPLEHEEQPSSLYLESQKQIPHLSRISFLHNLPEIPPAEPKSLKLP